MISIQQIENVKFRTFGWVQNPSNFRSLCDVVAVFDIDSDVNTRIKETVIPDLVAPGSIRDGLVAALSATPLSLTYLHLVGTGRTIRSTAPCDAIVQAIVTGQGNKRYTDNWTADGYVRWAHCLGFINYKYEDDSFSITDTGLELSDARGASIQLNEEEKRILVDAMLSYPPVIRVLTLLAEENAHLTKFEIGRQLGFSGEGGFTSMPQSILARSLSMSSDNAEKTAMRNNWEGSSDKYARMIARWLSKLGLVEQIEKVVTVAIGSHAYSETIGQAYMITAKGLTALRRSQGTSRHRRILKTLCYEMLASKEDDREFLRKRRSLIVKLLSESAGSITAENIVAYLEGHNIASSKMVVDDDIHGLVSIGLEIAIEGESYTWRDTINDFIIPVRMGITQSQFEHAKDELREAITYIPHDYLSLVDLAYDSKQNRLFEMKTLQLLTEECGYEGMHLGGSRKPDGIIYTAGQIDNYGIIIDTKAYSKGYSLPIEQADEMQRYVQENQRRDILENPNQWWEHFADNVKRYYFMFVAGHFTGMYKDQINRITRITKSKGAAVCIIDLLLVANEIKREAITLADVENHLNENESGAIKIFLEGKR